MSMPEMSNIVRRARETVQIAFDRLKESVTADDASFIQSNELQNVRSAARELEHNLADRQELRNLRRLEPLFEGLAGYSEAFQEMYRGTLFLPWIWAPVSLALQTSVRHLDILDQVISAYKKIAQALPDFKKLSVNWSEYVEGQQILADIYAIIVSFHQWTYNFLRRPGWAFFFNTSWSRFQRRFQKMLDELVTQRQLLERKARMEEILTTKQACETWQREIDEQDKAEAVHQRRTVESWLEASKLDQEDELDELLRRCHEGSCDWVHDNEKIKFWVRQGADHSILWLKGKPGSGKSVLCSHLIQHFQTSKETTVLYFLCTEVMPDSKQHGFFLRALVRQVIQKQPDLCTFIQNDFILQGFQSSVLQIRRLLPILISAFRTVRIIVDGIDECDEKQQKLILEDTTVLAKCENSLNSCKVLISSQDIVTISRKLQTRSCINLSHEHPVIQAAISSFVHSKITQNPLFQDTENKIIAQAREIEHKLVNKADGMFLWVVLVISEVENAYSIDEMRNAVDGFPEGLDKVYDRIFERFHTKIPGANKDRASRVFQWLACSQRPLKKFEIQDAVTLHPQNTRINDDTRLFDRVFELCKPLVEIGPNDVVRFVHVSVKELSIFSAAKAAFNLRCRHLLKHQPLFNQETAQFNAAFSCLAYFDTGVNLIDDSYDDESRFVEVGKGFHGLCRYASKHWVEHLLAYLASANGSPSCDSKERILKAADNLAVRLSLIMLRKPALPSPDKIERLDGRRKHLKGREPISSLVTSTLVGQLKRIAPRNVNDLIAEDPFLRMRQKYDDITKQLLQKDTVPGLDEKNLLAFKKSYGSSVLICRFSDCPRGLRGFETGEERDAHEKSHEVDLRCPYPDCNVSRIGVRSAKKLKQHLEEFHPKDDDVKVPSIRPLQESRVDTDATLVGSPGAEARPTHDSGGEEDEDEDEDSAPFGGLSKMSNIDLLALRTTEWNA